MKAILQSESNFSYPYNFFLVRLQNQYLEVTIKKIEDKKVNRKVKILYHIKKGIMKLKIFYEKTSIEIFLIIVLNYGSVRKIEIENRATKQC